MKILIVKVSALGDVVHALPILPWLKSADPSIQIDWLVEESFAPVLDGHPLLRKIIRLQTKAWRSRGVASGIRAALGKIGELRGEAYDVVLDLQGNSKSGLFTRFSGAPLRYGFERDGVREWPNLLTTNRKVSLGERDFHITDRSLAVARAAFPAGSDVRTAGPLPVDEAAAAAVCDTLAAAGLTSGQIVVLHYGTTWTTKLWALASWQELAVRLVRERGLCPVLTWGNEAERSAVQSIQDATNGQCFVWPRGSLKELIALLARADLVVGGDTGPVHIAAAVDTPTVSIFRVTDAGRNAPRGSRHRAIQSALDCSPCLRKSCELDGQCGVSISVDQVAEAVYSLLSSDEGEGGDEARFDPL
jgi:heptosyltransferase-1